MEISIRRWDDATFEKVLKETLSRYPTGRDIDLEEVVDYHRRFVPPHKNVPEMLARAGREGKTLLNPRAGVADLDPMRDLLKHLQDAGRADLLPINPDTYTRTEQFEKATAGLEQSIREGRSLLNGFPAVSHGLQNCRRLFESVDRPIVCRSVTPKAKLLGTMVIAGGATEICSGAVSLELCMEYDYPLEEGARNAQYLSRLAGWLYERGVKIALDTVTTAALGVITIPSLAIAAGIVDSLVAAEQGAGYLSVSYPPMHHMVQDIAGLRVQRRLTQAYMERFGHGDVRITQNIHQWNGVFPPDRAKAGAIIALIAAIAALYGKAEQMMVKTPEEGLGVPTGEMNAAGLVGTRQVMEMLRGQQYPDSEELREEAAVIEEEAECILRTLLEVGDGDMLVGVLRGLKMGVYEHPYCVNKFNANRVTLVRDLSGAVRILDAGNLPLPRRVLDYHRARIAERTAVEKREEYLMMIDDLREVRAPLPDG